MISSNRSNTDSAAVMRTVRDSTPNLLASDTTPGSNQQPPGPSSDRSKSTDTGKHVGSAGQNGTPPSAPSIRRDTPPPPAPNLAPAATRPQSGSSDVAASPGSNSATATPSADGRTGISDVRKRLGSKGQGDANLMPGHRDIDAASAIAQKSKAGEPELVLPEPKIAASREIAKTRFADQYNAGELEHLTTSETAQRLKLADQYRMLQQGDVARRLELQKHAGNLASHANVHHPIGPVEMDRFHDHHPNYYHGLISPAYEHHCLKYHYWGPTFFAGVCWYPTWTPWVEWSWHHRCNPFWDPRPVCCRPVIYDPCPPWVYYDVPAWTPLPEVSCGTWVDLSPVAVEPTVTDLQLVAVRFVDPGHPEENLGPRYRVWFRNNGNRPITHPFNVVLLAGNDDRPVADLPQAGVRVASIEAGDVQSVDIRLPVEVEPQRSGQPAAVHGAARDGRRQSRGGRHHAGQQRRAAQPGRDSAGRSGGVRVAAHHCSGRR
jgi:hypothetical protein